MVVMPTVSTRTLLPFLLGVLVACQSTSPAAPDEAAPVEEEPVAQEQLAEEPAAPPEWHWAGVELMGLRELDREEVMAAIEIEVGAVYQTDREAWARLKADLEQRFDCVEVRVTAVRYVGFEAFLVVDVVERGDEARLQYSEAPTGEVPIDPEILEVHAELDELRHAGFESGEQVREFVDGEFMDFDDPAMHALGLRLRELVRPQRLALIEVLARDRDRGKRGEAATLLNWGGDVTDSIARIHPFADDPESLVRNNVTRFMLHHLDKVEDAQVRQALITQFARQLTRPSHSDRNKAAYGLLLLLEAWPEDAPAVSAAARTELEVIARDSVLFNVRDPAREVLEKLGG